MVGIVSELNALLIMKTNSIKKSWTITNLSTGNQIAPDLVYSFNNVKENTSLTFVKITRAEITKSLPTHANTINMTNDAKEQSSAPAISF